jgi:hypothetical protein
MMRSQQNWMSGGWMERVDEAHFWPYMAVCTFLWAEWKKRSQLKWWDVR